MQVGKTKDQGLYNNPYAAVHPGALAAGTLPQHNTIAMSIKYMMIGFNSRHPSASFCHYDDEDGSWSHLTSLPVVR